MDADEHIEVFTYVLSVFGKPENYVVVLKGDSMVTSNTIVDRQNIPLTGLASYRFNLAVKDSTYAHEEVM